MTAPPVGRERTDRHTVTPQMSPPHLAPARVLGTSALVELLERTALELVAGSLDPAQTTVGTRIDVHHRRPAFPGEELAVRARLTGTGRRLEFALEARVGERVVATARHERAVIGRGRWQT